MYLSKSFFQNRLSVVNKLFRLDTEDQISFNGVTWNAVRVVDGGIRFVLIEKLNKVADESQTFAILSENKLVIKLNLEQYQ
jgi:hypothetical protein